ncbi:6931_t:CDS:2 [Ambispora leptoticha]|uniref:6931_t:CDS:1 n=1 Tax=Ambispora leptoticha TaxID=144679 RepID=A0A9N8V2G4_9GLOM|nr:6931_t:CDS:2 [Ambispora leptoticha]
MLVVCEKNAALQVIVNNLNSIELGSYFIKINELNQVPEISRHISSVLEENKKNTVETISSLTNLEDPLFDYLIFDEASQMPLEKSVPLFTRAKKLIVIEEEEAEWIIEENQTKEEKEHLKEIDESEINLEISDLGKGSSLVNGCWINQQNLVEAKAVLKLLKSLSVDKEIGIITFNTKQRDLLEDIIEKQKKKVNNLFVRNLEEVQGDERDIIIFSVGYGPNEEGKFIHNFGPLNREGGEKRLNVAITRAREKVIVVTSILPSQLSVESAKNSDTSQINLKVLLDSVYKAEDLIRKFVRKHLEKPETIPKTSKLWMNKPDIRTQFKAAGKEPYYKRAKDGVIDEVAGFRIEVNKLKQQKEKNDKEYWRARAEETRLTSADNIVKGGPVESELPSGLDLDLDEDGGSEHEHEVPGDGEKVPRPGGGNCPEGFCGNTDKATG